MCHLPRYSQPHCLAECLGYIGAAGMDYRYYASRLRFGIGGEKCAKINVTVAEDYMEVSTVFRIYWNVSYEKLF